MEGAGFRVKAGRIDSILVSLCFTSAPQRFQLALSDNSLVPFHLFSHILVYYLSPFWLGRSGANSQLYQGCSVTHAFFLLSWEVSISFSVVRKKRVIVPRRSLLSVRTTFRLGLSSRDFYDNITIDIDSSSFIMPTGAEIKTRGRRDWFAKSLVLLPTPWFIMQRIARAIEHLPVTHLEIVTVTYAPMNFVIYIFRWNVPLNDRLECSKNQIRERQIIVMVQENMSEVGRSPRSKNRSQRRRN